MIVIKIQGPAAIGKTTMAKQIHRTLTQQGLTLGERLGWWLLRNAAWNKFKILPGEIHQVEEYNISAAGLENLRRHGVKVMILDGAGS